MDTIRVLVADDEPNYRSALQKVLKLAPEIELVGMAADGREAFDLAQETEPDVLLTDINMPYLNGLQLTNRLTRIMPELQVVILTVSEDSEDVFEAIRSGAIGYILKDSTPKDVIEAIREAMRGESRMTPRIAKLVIEDFRRLVGAGRPTEEEHFYELSKREREMLQFLAEGKKNKEIADALSLAEKTVKNHVSSILRKLHVNTRTEAAMKAVREGLV
ncbi:MAG: response regulator transcription factor [Fimbriimonadia bacterium]|jgi:DNA-binding NarL/FixJ family response regulator